MTITTPVVTKTPFWLQAEPNWPVLASEWPDDYEYNQYVCIYCDLETKATVAVTVGNSLDTLFGSALVWEKEPSYNSWCGYQWDEDGSCYTLEYGDEADQEWWAIDDVLFGAFETSYLGMVNPDTHCVVTIEEIVEHYKDSCYLYSVGLCKNAIAYWWHEVTPQEEVAYGLTDAEALDEQEKAQALLKHLEN